MVVVVGGGGGWWVAGADGRWWWSGPFRHHVSLAMLEDGELVITGSFDKPLGRCRVLHVHARERMQR